MTKNQQLGQWRALMLALGSMLTTCSALCDPYKVDWTVAQPQAGVSFKVVRWEGEVPVTLATTSRTSVTLELKAGDRISVIATSEHFPDAPPSTPLTIPAPPEQPRLIAVPIQISTDLKTWKSTLILIPENMTNNGSLPQRLFIKP